MVSAAASPGWAETSSSSGTSASSSDAGAAGTGAAPSHSPERSISAEGGEAASSSISAGGWESAGELENTGGCGEAAGGSGAGGKSASEAEESSGQGAMGISVSSVAARAGTRRGEAAACSSQREASSCKPAWAYTVARVWQQPAASAKRSERTYKAARRWLRRTSLGAMGSTAISGPSALSGML